MKLWAERHLNWSLALSSLLATVLIFVSLPLVEANTLFFCLLFGISIVFIFWIEVWYLRQKKRSLWNLLWNLIGSPLNLIILLSLKNLSREEVQS